MRHVVNDVVTRKIAGVSEERGPSSCEQRICVLASSETK